MHIPYEPRLQKVLRWTRGLHFVVFHLSFCLICWMSLAMASNPAISGKEALVQIPLPARTLAGPPELQIEAGMHIANIIAIAQVPSKHSLITGSLDGTIRAWNLESGQLTRTLRMPGLTGTSASISAIAIAPSGEQVAVAVLRGKEADSSSDLFVCNLSTGEVLHQVHFGAWTGIDQKTGKLLLMRSESMGRPTHELTVGSSHLTQLAWSPDEKRLAVGYASYFKEDRARDLSGVFLLRLADKTVLGRFQTANRVAYPPQVEGIVFGAQDRAVVAISDGRLVALDSNFGLSASTTLPGAGSAQLCMSRGGALAIMTPDRRSLEMRNTGDLSVIRRLEGVGLQVGNGGSDLQAGIGTATYKVMAWTPDGSKLHVARTVPKAGLVSWASDGKPVGQWSHDGGPITALAILQNGEVAVATRAPVTLSVGTLGSAPRFVKRSPALTIAAAPDVLSVAGEGFDIKVNPTGEAKSAVWFSMKSRSFGTAPLKGSFALPVRQAPGFKVEVEPRLHRVKVNLGWLPLAPAEAMTAWAIVPVRHGALVGTTKRLLFASQAPGTVEQKKWSVALPAEVVGVTSSGDGQIAVAALSDGTVRWYKMKDGTNLLNVFLHADLRRFVAWTPSGEFDAAPGATELAGWQVSYGPEFEPDIFPISRFRERYYRPGLSNAVLTTLDSNATKALDSPPPDLSRLGSYLPPVVRIESSFDQVQRAGARAELPIILRSPSGRPITAIRVLVGGRPLDGPAVKVSEKSLNNKSLNVDAAARLVTIPMPISDADVSVLAANENGWSQPATTRLRVPASIPTQGSVLLSHRPSSANSWVDERPIEYFSAPPSLYVLAVGLTTFKDPSMLKVRFAGKDAREVASFMQTQQGKLYQKVETRVLVDAEATRDKILEGLKWLREKVGPNDVALLYLAGHGINHPDGRYKYLPYEGDTNAMKQTMLFDTDIAQGLIQVDGKVILLLDTCYSGGITDAVPHSKRALTDQDGFANELSAPENGVIVLTSSTGAEVSLESPANQHGMFTLALVEGLAGKADPRATGFISVYMLDLYVSERVRQLTDGDQNPTVTIPTGAADFPVAATP